MCGYFDSSPVAGLLTDQASIETGLEEVGAPN